MAKKIKILNWGLKNNDGKKYWYFAVLEEVPENYPLRSFSRKKVEIFKKIGIDPSVDFYSFEELNTDLPLIIYLKRIDGKVRIIPNNGKPGDESVLIDET